MGLGDDTGEPFLVAFVSQTNATIVVSDAEVSHTIKVSGINAHKIPDKYVPPAKLYIDGDLSNIYLYNDVTMQNKTTQNELLAAINDRPIIVSAIGISFFTPIIVQAYGFNGEEPYGYIIIQRENTDGTLINKTYYTAEYTAT